MFKVTQKSQKSQKSIDNTVYFHYVNILAFDFEERFLLFDFDASREFKSYVGLKGAESKLRKYLTEFEFTDIATANESVDWDKAAVVRVG